MTRLQATWGVIAGLLTTLALYQVIDFPYWIDFIAVTFFGTSWMFTGGIYAKSLYDQKKGGDFLIWVWAPGVAFFIFLDVVFNLTLGSIFFKEWPKELLFTDRVKRHMNSTGFRFNVAKRWAKRLNVVDPGHV